MINGIYNDINPPPHSLNDGTCLLKDVTLRVDEHCARTVGLLAVGENLGGGESKTKEISTAEKLENICKKKTKTNSVG